MERNLQKRNDVGGNLVVELKEAQKTAQEIISTKDLPFDLTAELGEVVKAEWKNPGVYFLSTRKEEHYSEVYVVTADAPAISEKARSYGREFPGHSDLRVYDVHQPGSGRHVIDFETRRYQMKCHLPIEETGDSLLAIALYGMEEHPDYFGTYPVPFFTPRGCTVRHRMLMNGVYWLETDRCEEMLSICYPIWQDITIPEQNLAEQLAFDQMQGINNTLGYLFFPMQNSCIPLYELCGHHPEIKDSGAVDMVALENAIWQFFPEYAVAHNEEESKYERGRLIRETPNTGTKFFTF